MSSDLPIPRQDRPVGHQDTAPDDPSAPGDETEPTADGASVVSWGDSPRNGRRASLVLSRLGRDGRLVPVVAILGAGAIFASLLADWAVTVMPTEGSPTGAPIGLASGVADLATFGTAYLVGVFGMIGCLALVFFGSPGIRHNARVLGLALTAAVIGMLVAVTGSLDSLTNDWQVYGELGGLVTAYGRGLGLAYLGSGGLGLALLLAGRFVRRTATTVVPDDGAATPTGPADPATPEESDWPWRRPRSASAPDPDDEDDRSTPIDLTVTPTKPFTH
ncbi:hypothetical protein I0C86_03760 [Plantactinospora sp. S1510]|uniref:Uncharacterized protein n=1 Tax=Plantactinospora alkalitolerans TaxID=2789879 RepID=A0ABS0GQD5_9ACTN|nr:hypothetical protein [Plantactinospora alkalitolerans]MBF9128112.1 hypothetical protein [Plantactinospora alkalitolerans]